MGYARYLDQKNRATQKTTGSQKMFPTFKIQSVMAVIIAKLRLKELLYEPSMGKMFRNFTD
jgi:hypothetical protein